MTEKSKVDTGSSDDDVSDEEIEFLSDQEKELERELADIPFGELQKALADGSHTSRPKRGTTQKLGRANKNRPSELSCKAPVGRFREVIQAPKKVVRDPRFESLSGTLDPEGFRKRYNFLYEVELPAEKEKLQKLLKKSKDPNVTEELKSHISWIDKQLKSAPRRSAESEILSEHMKKEREAAKKGKNPYYLKKSEIRERKLTKKYNDLKAQGKLESYIEKRRRKNASKDHRYMPYGRSNEAVQDE
ncbi:ribosomal RNA processing protein 36-like protein isoform X2 [Iris pallida]|uniref:rRNA biogenesis protein RRP36 n=1 Tax=Iris pallida TaxID=29817 RepID=A0AAX6GCI2_IRIPA|nr:ribosomal RNA processing protein 36-like protein isoform X2 [Iris pallida]